MILCVVIFVAAIGAVGMAVTVSAEQSNNLSSVIVGSKSGTGGVTKGFSGTKNAGGFPSLGDVTGKSGKNTSASQGPWLPDPCNVLGVSGRYVKTQKISGTNVKYYSYELKTTIKDVAHKISNYTWALYEKLDYQIRELQETGDIIMATGLTKNGVTAELYLVVIDDSDYCGEYSEITMEVLLAVPESMEFQLGRKTPGIINGENECPSCEGSKVCEFCHGYGKVNYGAGYETCVNCDGNKRCTICGGSGIID